MQKESRRVVQLQAHWQPLPLLVLHQPTVTAAWKPEDSAVVVGSALMVASFVPVVEVERTRAEMTES